MVALDYLPVVVFALIPSHALAQNTASLSQVTSILNGVASNASSNNPLGQSFKVLQQNSAVLGSIVTAANAVSGLVQNILNPELAYSYGKSPPVFPAPDATAAGEWAPYYASARAMVAHMTNEEKNNITVGISATQGCSGFSGSAPRVGFPGICLNDGPANVHNVPGTNAYPPQLHIGASWNRSLAYVRGDAMGYEFKQKGVSVALGPVVGPIGRVAKGGRNWEGFGADPYLAGQLSNPTITGLQNHVIACVKHFVANEQETNRLPFLAGFLPGVGTQSVSSNVDDRTMHEIYLWPFYDSVKAGVGSVMSSYNRINNSYATQNSKVQNGLLKYELGFQGFLVSDWYAQRTGVASAQAGLDLVMPSSLYWGNNQLVTAVNNGSIPSSRLDDMVTRIVASYLRFAPDPAPGVDSRSTVDARVSSADSVLLQSAVEGHVLVKNTNNALPLDRPRQLSIFGYDALGGRNTSAADSIAFSFGLVNTPNYTDGSPFNAVNIGLFFAEAMPAQAAGPPVALAGTLLGGGGSGALSPISSYSPYDGIALQSQLDNTTLFVDFYSQKPVVKAPSDPCLVFINAQSAESWDRSSLSDSYSDTLVKNVANQCANTIVVIHNAGVRLVDGFADHPNVTAIIYGHTPGQASGLALAEILYGGQSPSGRLPYTVAESEADYGSLLNPAVPTSQDPMFPQSDFNEGLYIDYKAFIKNNIQPRYAFGYGLTYTEFSYSSLSISRNSSVSTTLLPPDLPSSNYTVAPEGGLASLYDEIATVTIQVSNTGARTAAEVAQLYIGAPNSPPKVLRGFEKHSIAPGASATFTFPLQRRDLSIWDVTRQQWILQPGSYSINVGKSVLDIQLTGTLTI